MTDKNLRLEGIYPQRQKEFFMQRVKLPAGIISAVQALKVAQLARRHARGVVHLTTRGSIELHWLTESDLPVVAAQLAQVGLYNRGACGGAVRGVICGSLSAAGAPALEALVRKIHRHFTGNPRYEKLPKKFKIGVEADTSSKRHLIQDLAFVPAPSDDGRSRYDVYAAGGLGREPVPGFLLAQGVAEEAIIPLVERVLVEYEANTPPPKRLKFLVGQIGQEEFRRRVLGDGLAELPVSAPTLTASLVPVPAADEDRLEAHVFAGELAADGLAALAAVAATFCGGMLMVTGNQTVVMHVVEGSNRKEARQALAEAGFANEAAAERVVFRVCPGNHECLMGLAATRDVAAAVVAELGEEALKLNWAISGCPNCCAQPQLAQAGIVASRLVSDQAGRTPRFDLYRAGAGAFAEPVQQGLTLAELLAEVKKI
ncbi:nitrite/sulfite reductase [Geomonas oryzisoli]|uniref:Nitrite/sulfite reductase n=1 Tax=Geomonas oryzisoli TaxID=2847992 RepID=A0ABX8J3I9_9BACT|nr:nitrite/sulfite reductase [Geomonas oryzisoli]QWV92980.1 nitrite/sulfite reductase [Geomonas oryzisoli]